MSDESKEVLMVVAMGCLVLLGLICNSGYQRKLEAIETLKAMEQGYTQEQNVGINGYHWVPVTEATLRIQEVCE